MKLKKLDLNSDNNDETYLEFVVNGSTEFTSEAGDVKFTITFYKLANTSDGKIEQLVRKTKEGIIQYLYIKDSIIYIRTDSTIIKRL